MLGWIAPTAGEALPIVPMLAIFAAWGAKDGGFDPVVWLPGALFALGMSVVFVLWKRDRFALGRATVAATLFLSAFTVWCYASVSWAEVKADAWDGANRTLLYLCVFVVFSSQRLRPRIALALLGGYAVAIAVVGAADLARAAVATSDDGFFIAGRLATPITYPNANAALFLAACLPAVVLASRRNAHPLVRGPALAAAGVLLELALLCQSRASLVAFPLAVAVLIALTPRRLSVVLALSPLAASVGTSAHRLLAVYPAVVSGRLVPQRLAEARAAVLWTAIALFTAGFLLAVADRRVQLSPLLLRRLGLAIALAAGSTVVAAGAFLVVRFGSPVHGAAALWRDFKSVDPPSSSRSSHFLSGVGSPRYDLWRVALDVFANQPLRGVGVDNFAVDYLRLRRTHNEPLYPHSLELRLLAQTGIVGAVLFSGFLASAGVAAAAAFRRRTRPSRRALAAACLAAFSYWILHASVDWLWAYPALTAPAFACLGIATQAAFRRSSGVPRRRWPGPVRYAVLAPALAAAFSLVLPWAAAHEVDAALAGWRADPQQAFRRLDLARRLNPLSDHPDLTAGVIAVHLGDGKRAEKAFAAALERNPKSWFAHLELAALESERGRRGAALRQLRAAQALDPREPLIAEGFEAIRAGKRLTPAALSAALRERVQLLTGEKQR